MKKTPIEPLTKFKTELKSFIKKNYASVEEFCWDTDLSKATVSNFINDKKDFRVSTLVKIANAMNKKLAITLY